MHPLDCHTSGSWREEWKIFTHWAQVEVEDQFSFPFNAIPNELTARVTASNQIQRSFSVLISFCNPLCTNCCAVLSFLLFLLSHRCPVKPTFTVCMWLLWRWTGKMLPSCVRASLWRCIGELQRWSRPIKPVKGNTSLQKTEIQRLHSLCLFPLIAQIEKVLDFWKFDSIF